MSKHVLLGRKQVFSLLKKKQEIKRSFRFSGTFFCLRFSIQQENLFDNLAQKRATPTSKKNSIRLGISVNLKTPNLTETIDDHEQAMFGHKNPQTPKSSYHWSFGFSSPNNKSTNPFKPYFYSVLAKLKKDNLSQVNSNQRNKNNFGTQLLKKNKIAWQLG